jgi:hypothetical protein
MWGAMARLFTMRDFHDNAMKSYFISRYERGMAQLKRDDIRLLPDVPPDTSDQAWDPVE